MGRSLYTVALVSSILQFGSLVSGAATWPSSYDELEDIKVLNTGYRARGLSAPVSPCDFQKTTSFVPAAGFVRTAFHDVAGHNSATGVGGLDASIAFELTGIHGADNAGPFVNNSLTFLSRYYSTQASMADLMALGLYTSVRSCGGPDIATKTGRIDAQEAGPLGVPKPNDTQTGYKDTFARIGFNPQEMIKLVACGHTLGGVHREQFPEIATKANLITFDTTESKFDNRVAVEYVTNTTKNPLVTAPNASFRSDKTIFTIDNDQTIKQMTDAQYFQNECKVVMQKMIDTVPSSVSLTEPIEVYDVKPGSLSLALTGNGTIVFNGEIRVRTTAGDVGTVSLVYKDRDGIKGNNTISTTLVGTASGYDDSFAFYSFSAKFNSRTSITAFDVIVNGKTYNNNGKSFPVGDSIFVQLPACSVSVAGSVEIVAAVRGSASSVVLSASTQTTRDVPMPLISTEKVTMTKDSSAGEYTYYKGTFQVTAQQLASATFDLSAIVDGVTVEDKFHRIAGFGGGSGGDGGNGGDGGHGGDGGDGGNGGNGGNGGDGGSSDWTDIPNTGNTGHPGSGGVSVPDTPYQPSRPCGELEGCETLPWVHDLPVPGPDTYAPPGSPNAPAPGSSSGSSGGNGGSHGSGPDDSDNGHGGSTSGPPYVSGPDDSHHGSGGSGSGSGSGSDYGSGSGSGSGSGYSSGSGSSSGAAGGSGSVTWPGYGGNAHGGSGSSSGSGSDHGSGSTSGSASGWQGASGSWSDSGHVPVAPASPASPVESFVPKVGGSSNPNSPIAPYTGAASKTGSMSGLFVGVAVLLVAMI